jgi:carbon storage regulator CsrA
MLILARKLNEAIVLQIGGETIVVQITRVDGSSAKIGVLATEKVIVDRLEVWLAKQNNAINPRLDSTNYPKQLSSEVLARFFPNLDPAKIPHTFCKDCDRWEGPDKTGLSGLCSLFVKPTGAYHGDKCTAHTPKTNETNIPNPAVPSGP